MCIYAAYAPIYDAIGQAAFAEQLTRRILAHLPSLPQRALDLACGTGAAALSLAEAGLEVVGLDRSPQMLQLARGRARDRRLPISWIEADLRSLATRSAKGAPEADLLAPASFQLITCLYDSLNYLTGDGELELALRGAAQLLAPGGHIFFDLNTEAEFTRWHETDQVIYDDKGLLVYNRLSYEPAQRLAEGRIVWFSRAGEQWWRGEETHLERAWSDAEVGAALEAAGLSLVARYTPAWQPAAADAPRVVYVGMPVPSMEHARAK